MLHITSFRLAWYSALRSNLTSSRPFPLMGSKDVMIACLWSGLCSATAQRFDGDLAQEFELYSGNMKIGSGVPPLLGIRTSCKGLFGWGPFQTWAMTHFPSGLSIPNITKIGRA